MSSDAGDETRISPGFPIRTPSDHSPVIDSPRLIADSNVLHRFLVPRHPPCALKNLTLQRCSRPLCNSQHTNPHQPATHASHANNRPVRPHTRASQPQPTPQTPNSAPHDHHTRHTTLSPPPSHRRTAVLTTAHLPQQPTIDVPPTSTHSSHHTRAASRAPHP